MNKKANRINSSKPNLKEMIKILQEKEKWWERENSKLKKETDSKTTGEHEA